MTNKEIHEKFESLENNINYLKQDVITLKTSSENNGVLLNKLVDNLIQTDKDVRNEQYKTWGIIGTGLMAFIAIIKGFFTN